MKMYYTDFSLGEIYEDDITRTTEYFVVVAESGRRREHRSARLDSHGGFFDTWEEAYSALLSYHEKSVQVLRSRLISAEGKLADVRTMKP
jgi:hypothetical protein